MTLGRAGTRGPAHRSGQDRRELQGTRDCLLTVGGGTHPQADVTSGDRALEAMVGQPMVTVTSRCIVPGR